MTTGVRIAQKRKELGLSQEQLGEQLGVSRQSIYKWESDAALPEVEKLVALSKLYSVTVGWLLGVEDESKDAWDGELTEAQLRMVEEIAARYRPTPDKKKRRQLMIAATVAAVVIVAVFIALFARMSKLQHGYNTLQGQVGSIQEQFGNMQNDVQIQIAGITSQVTSALEQQTKITSSSETAIKGADLTANTVTFTVSATPKTYTEGTQAVFIAQSEGKSVEVPATLGEGQRFSAEVTCPLSNEVNLSVAFISDGTRQTEVIWSYYDLYQSTVCYYFDELVPMDDSGQLDEGIYENHMLQDTFCTEQGLPCPEVDQVRMGLFRDKKLVKWLTKLDNEPEGWVADLFDEGTWVFFQNDKAVPFDEGHSYTLAIVLTDSCGRDLIYPGWTYTSHYGQWSHAENVSLPIAADTSGDWQF